MKDDNEDIIAPENICKLEVCVTIFRDDVLGVA